MPEFTLHFEHLPGFQLSNELVYQQFEEDAVQFPKLVRRMLVLRNPAGDYQFMVILRRRHDSGPAEWFRAHVASDDELDDWIDLKELFRDCGEECERQHCALIAELFE